MGISSPAATASSGVSAPSEPLPGKRRHFSYLAAPWEASSQPEAGRRPRRPSHAHTSAHAPPAPGPWPQRWGRQVLRIPAINHKAFGNSIIVYPNPFGQCTVTECIGVLGWCLTLSQAPEDLACWSAERRASWLLAPGGQVALAQFRPRLLSGLLGPRGAGQTWQEEPRALPLLPAARERGEGASSSQAPPRHPATAAAPHGVSGAQTC